MVARLRLALEGGDPWAETGEEEEEDNAEETAGSGGGFAG